MAHHAHASDTRFTLPPLPPSLRRFVQGLPWQPPSLLLALSLQRLMWPKLRASQRRELAGAVVAIEVADLGLQCRVWLNEQRGFSVAPSEQTPRVRVRASSSGYLRLLKGQEDPDRLFFERALVLEGDTEYGLLLKNTLDALGPIWP